MAHGGAHLTPALGETTHVCLFEPLFLQLSLPPHEAGDVQHASAWTNLPSSASTPSGDSSGWHEVRLDSDDIPGAQSTGHSAAWTASAVVFPTHPGSYDLTARVSHRSSHHVRWMGHFGQNAHVAVASASPAGAHKLMPAPSVHAITRVAEHFAYGVRMLLSPRPSCDKLLDPSAPAGAAMTHADVLAHAYVCALTHAMITHTQSNTPHQNEATSHALLHLLLALPLMRTHASARVRVLSRLLGCEHTHAQALLTEALPRLSYAAARSLHPTPPPSGACSPRSRASSLGSGACLSESEGEEEDEQHADEGGRRTRALISSAAALMERLSFMREEDGDAATPAQAGRAQAALGTPLHTADFPSVSDLATPSLTGPAALTPAQHALFTLGKWAAGSHFDAMDPLQALALDLFINALQHVYPTHVHQALVVNVLQTLATSTPTSIVRVYFARALRTLFSRGVANVNAATVKRAGDRKPVPNLAKSVIIAIHDIIHAHLADLALAQGRTRRAELPPIAPSSASLTMLPGLSMPAASTPASPRQAAETPNPNWSSLAPRVRASQPPGSPACSVADALDERDPFMHRSGSAAVLRDGSAAAPARGAHTLSPVVQRSPSGGFMPSVGGSNAETPERRKLETSRTDTGFDLQVLMGFIGDLLHQSRAPKSADSTPGSAPASSARPASRSGSKRRSSSSRGGITYDGSSSARGDAVSCRDTAADLSCSACTGPCAIRVSTLTTAAVLPDMAVSAAAVHESSADAAQPSELRVHAPGVMTTPPPLVRHPTPDTVLLSPAIEAVPDAAARAAASLTTPPARGTRSLRSTNLPLSFATGMDMTPDGTSARGGAAAHANDRAHLTSLCPSSDGGGTSLGLWMEAARAVAHAAVRLSAVPDGGDGVTPEYKSVLACALQLCSSCPLLREIVLRRVLRKWPAGNSDNEIALLEFLATVLATTTHRADLVVTDLRALMLSRITRCVRATHIKVARNALVLVDPARRLVDFLIDDAPSLRRLLEALYANVRAHWSPLVRKASSSTFDAYARELERFMPSHEVAEVVDAIARMPIATPNSATPNSGKGSTRDEEDARVARRAARRASRTASGGEAGSTTGAARSVTPTLPPAAAQTAVDVAAAQGGARGSSPAVAELENALRKSPASSPPRSRPSTATSHPSPAAGRERVAHTSASLGSPSPMTGAVPTPQGAAPPPLHPDTLRIHAVGVRGALARGDGQEEEGPVSMDEPATPSRASGRTASASAAGVAYSPLSALAAAARASATSAASPVAGAVPASPAAAATAASTVRHVDVAHAEGAQNGAGGGHLVIRAPTAVQVNVPAPAATSHEQHRSTSRDRPRRELTHIPLTLGVPAAPPPPVHSVTLGMPGDAMLDLMSPPGVNVKHVARKSSGKIGGVAAHLDADARGKGVHTLPVTPLTVRVTVPVHHELGNGGAAVAGVWHDVTSPLDPGAASGCATVINSESPTSTESGGSAPGAPQQQRNSLEVVEGAGRQ